MLLVTLAGIWKAGQLPLQLSALLNFTLSAADQTAIAFQTSTLRELIPTGPPVDPSNRPVTTGIYNAAAPLPLVTPASYIQLDTPPHTFSPEAVSAIEQAALDYQLLTNPPATEVPQPSL